MRGYDKRQVNIAGAKNRSVDICDNEPALRARVTELSANSCISEGEVATEELWTCSYNNVALDTPCSHPTAELLILQTHLCCSSPAIPLPLGK